MPFDQLPSSLPAHPLLRAARGHKAARGLVYLPYSSHGSTGYSDRALNNLIGATAGQYLFGTFINSFRDRVVLGGMVRDVPLGRRIGVEYSFGLTLGYQGKSAGGMPPALRSLFEGNVNPFATLSPYYRVSERLDLRVLWVPGVVMVGSKYRF